VGREHFGFFPPNAEWDALSATAAPRDCFADEIAIDFPSVGQFVARVLDRFLGAQAEVDTLTAEVSVSRREASRGTVCRSTCRSRMLDCGGRGETWAEPCLRAAERQRAVHHPVRCRCRGVVNGARLRFRVSSPLAAPVRVEILAVRVVGGLRHRTSRLAFTSISPVSSSSSGVS
jgi:hypothetical protein